MKKIVYILILSVLTLTGVVSCDVMDQYPHNAVSREQITEEDLGLLHVGLYNYMQHKPSFTGYFQPEMAGGDFVRGGASSYATPELWIMDCVTPINDWVTTPWQGYYTCLYQVNEFITVALPFKGTKAVNNMLGDAYYFRALIYYNLVSRYRNVMILRAATNEAIPNSTEAEGWNFVVENLELAAGLCADFTSKHYVSKQAVYALMARTKLAQGKKKEAADYAMKLINDSNFALANFDQIFREKDNKEEIFTFLNSKEENGINFANSFYKTATYRPSEEVINLFDGTDKRYSISIYQDSDEMVLNKYNNKTSTNPIIVSRLAEMYLIAAEGYGVSNGLQYLNKLREKRGLGSVSVKNESELIDAVLAERRLEFLGEGFRWFDLVRTGKYTTVLNLPEKYTVFPIPQKERDLNSNLKQNELWK